MRVPGEVETGHLRGFKTTPPKYNSKMVLVSDSMLVVTLELPNTSGLAAHLAKLCRTSEAVDVTLEPNQTELDLKPAAPDIGDVSTGLL